jgi:hypothetical protein
LRAVLDRPAIGILAGLLLRDGMSMREVLSASGTSPQRGRLAHRDLEAWGLVETRRRGQGAVRVASVRLTHPGREVARLLLRAHGLIPANDAGA